MYSLIFVALVVIGILILAKYKFKSNFFANICGLILILGGCSLFYMNLTGMIVLPLFK